MNVLNFSKKVEILQCERGLNTSALAKRVGKSRQCVNRIKKSRRPCAQTVKKFAHALQVPVQYFFEE